MAGTTRQAFNEFMEAITITDYQKTSIVKGRKDSVIENLTSTFPSSSDMPFWKAELMGSAEKGTIVRPLDDIDVLAVFSDEKGAWSKYQWNSQDFLYRVRRAYDGVETAKVGARGQAVRVFFQSGGHVDVAPVFMKNDSQYYLPAGDGTWITTAPFVANLWFHEKNRVLDYNLAGLVRLLKKWNIAHSKRLKSFHLETMAAHTFTTLSSNRRTSLQKFFEWGGSYLDVNDPGGQSGSISGYLSWLDRSEILKSFDAASERAVRAIAAENEGKHDEAKRLWRITLGSSFPA